MAKTVTKEPPFTIAIERELYPEFQRMAQASGMRVRSIPGLLFEGWHLLSKEQRETAIAQYFRKRSAIVSSA